MLRASSPLMRKNPSLRFEMTDATFEGLGGGHYRLQTINLGLKFPLFSNSHLYTTLTVPKSV
uniref:Uncharacterized protein n=1 Tax=Candidatus Kentrum sp. MB TaxID=2138164 RepID=A0A451B9U6_9GAMM|nr:MAG: hypothetical protein BECKMB1821I_GA0114274_101341 [Candidatus Kentron sp. MB]VFK75045.1 MAG: hypothetical protein BECKMB1821H_GA0114242_101441 [Candidatus Kentron sp. MB]